MTVAQAAAALQQGGTQLLRQLVGPWVLVGLVPNEDGTADWSYRTLSARSIKYSVGDEHRVLNEHDRVFGAIKARPGAFRTTLLIGRSSSNDVCLAHASVSKLHARIRVVSDEELWLSDAGSSNGTRYAGEELTNTAERRLRHGAIARFGVVDLQTLETDRFTRLLEELQRALG